MINVTIDRSGDGAPTVNVSCPGFDGSYEAWQAEDSDLTTAAIAYIHDVAEELEIKLGCERDWNTLRSHDPASEDFAEDFLDCEEDVSF